MDYGVIRKNEKQFVALTSLQVTEFDWVLDHFESEWEKYYRYHTLTGEKRKVLSFKEHGNCQLKGTGQKLFFLLVYLKTNALQEHQAASFGLTQSKVSRIVRVLLTTLKRTLTRLKLAPLREGERLAERLEGHFNQVFTYDGIERGIERNQDQDAQAEEYSGKKKAIA